MGNVAVTAVANGWQVKFIGDLANRPIDEFVGVSLLTFGGVPRLASDGSSPTVVTFRPEQSVSAVQRVTLPTHVTEGTFTLGFGGQTTAPIQISAAAADIQAALEALGSIGAGNVTVASVAGTGTSTPAAWTVTFGGSLAGRKLENLLASRVTGFGLGVTQPTASVAAIDAVQHVMLEESVAGGTFRLSYGGETTGAIAWDASASDLQTSLAALSTIGVGGVSVATDAVGWAVTFTGPLGGRVVGPVEVVSTSLTSLVATITVGTDTDNAVQQVTMPVTALGGTFKLGYGSATTAAIAWNASAGEVQSGARGPRHNRARGMSRSPQWRASAASGR